MELVSRLKALDVFSQTVVLFTRLQILLTKWLLDIPLDWPGMISSF
jgi:hypothetical protein